MNLNSIRASRAKYPSWKNFISRATLLEKVEKSISVDLADVTLGNTVTIAQSLTKDETELLYECAKELIPWRKGPFDICGIEIDSEWQSFLKYNLLKPHFDLENKIVADVGCNNGYYMFKMLEDKPTRLVGFDPSPLFKMQFEFVNHFIKSDIQYELLGVEHIEYYEHKFDFIFMLGVLYHRSDPVSTLKSLSKSLNKNGEIIIDTFMIDGDNEMVLTPRDRYSNIPNIYFVPTVPALKNWLRRAGFCDMEVLETVVTTVDEQRKTKWSFDHSLEDFLDSNDSSKTVEGYPAPKRVYIKARKEEGRFL
jgi:tRNA (mo5U34)-methyltransferase